MKIIINCADEAVKDAVDLAMQEINEGIGRYDRPGWGWFYRKGAYRFFVRGIKNGISVHQKAG